MRMKGEGGVACYTMPEKAESPERSLKTFEKARATMEEIKKKEGLWGRRGSRLGVNKHRISGGGEE